jgi:hypothetical protein
LPKLPTAGAASGSGTRDGGSAAASAPLVRIRSQNLSKRGALTLELDVLSPVPGAPVRIDALVDGQGVRGAQLAVTRGLVEADQYTLVVPVPRRDFVLTLLVQSAGAASARVELRIHKSTLDTRPLLNILAVGVGQYQDAEIPQLQYPAKDARDLVSTLQAQEESVYRDVQPRLLTEKGAALEPLRQGLKWLQEVTTAEDTALVFLAGHGTSDPDGSYFFLPVDANSERTTMLSGAELQEALRNIPGKVVLLLDTCHSGNVLWRRSLVRLINELVTENRIIVLAASTGDQSSRESPAWQNGAFTKALVEGLRGAADYAEDNQVTLSELETWVGVRVAELTRGAQTPVLAKPNAAPDYVLAALPRRSRIHNPQVVRRRQILWGTIAGVVGLGAAIVGTVLAGNPWQTPSVDLTFQPASTASALSQRQGR